MLIAVNTRFLLKDKLEGMVGTYETMRRLTQRHPEHKILFLFDREFDPHFYSVKILFLSRYGHRPGIPYLCVLVRLFHCRRCLKISPLFISTDSFIVENTCTYSAGNGTIGFEHYPEHTPAIVSKYYRPMVHRSLHIRPNALSLYLNFQSRISSGIIRCRLKKNVT